MEINFKEKFQHFGYFKIWKILLKIVKTRVLDQLKKKERKKKEKETIKK